MFLNSILVPLAVNVLYKLLLFDFTETLNFYPILGGAGLVHVTAESALIEVHRMLPSTYLALTALKKGREIEVLIVLLFSPFQLCH